MGRYSELCPLLLRTATACKAYGYGERTWSQLARGGYCFTTPNEVVWHSGHYGLAKDWRHQCSEMRSNYYSEPRSGRRNLPSIARVAMGTGAVAPDTTNG
jgi:hypothetical protein